MIRIIVPVDFSIHHVQLEDTDNNRERLLKYYSQHRLGYRYCSTFLPNKLVKQHMSP